MTIATTVMGLLKAVGTDNARDYLKTYLASALDLLDAHDHTGGAKAGQIPTGGLADAAVTAAKLAADAIEAAKIKDLAVATAKIADLAVTTAKLADLAVTAAKLAADAVETAKIKDGNVTTPKIADDAVDDSKVGARVPAVVGRKGFDAGDWSWAGDNDYTGAAIGNLRIQLGVAGVTTTKTVTFPVAFSNKPIVFTTNLSAAAPTAANSANITNTQCVLTHDDGPVPYYVAWFAIGPVA